MKIITLAAISAAFFASSALAAPSSDWKDITNVTAKIYTNAHISLQKRLDKCHITVNKAASWVEVLAADKPQYGAKKGDTVLMLKMDFPPIKQKGGPDSPGLKNITGLWVIDKKGSATPVSGWADRLLYKTVPLADNYGMKC